MQVSVSFSLLIAILAGCSGGGIEAPRPLPITAPSVIVPSRPGGPSSKGWAQAQISVPSQEPGNAPAKTTGAITKTPVPSEPVPSEPAPPLPVPSEPAPPLSVPPLPVPPLPVPSEPAPSPPDRTPVEHSEKKLPARLWQPVTVTVGDTVLAIEGVRCHEPDEALVFVERGTVTKVADSGEQITLILTERFDAWFDRRRAGSSDVERWCIPRRRVCWETVAFSDWNGTDQAGGTRSFAARSVSPDGTDVMPNFVEYAARSACRINH